MVYCNGVQMAQQKSNELNQFILSGFSNFNFCKILYQICYYATVEIWCKGIQNRVVH
jgi:hypothetical protein